MTTTVEWTGLPSEEVEPVTQARVIASEWVKSRSLRSSFWMVGAAVVGMIAIGFLVAFNTRHLAANIQSNDADASGPLQGYYLAMYLIGALGMLYVSGEYGTGMIRSMLTAEDLAELIDRPVHIPSAARHLHVGPVHEPTVTDRMAARPRRVDQARREPLHPPVHGHVIDLDPRLDQQFLDIAIRQAIAQVPGDRENDHGRREPETSERRTRDRGYWVTTAETSSLPPSRPPALPPSRPHRPHRRLRRCVTASVPVAPFRRCIFGPPAWRIARRAEVADGRMVAGAE